MTSIILLALAFAALIITGIIYRHKLWVVGLNSSVVILLALWMESDDLLQIMLVTLLIPASGMLFNQDRRVAIVTAVIALCIGFFNADSLYLFIPLFALSTVATALVGLMGLLLKKLLWTRQLATITAILFIGLIGNVFMPIPSALPGTSITGVSEQLAYVENTDQLDRKHIRIMMAALLSAEDASLTQRDEERLQYVLELLNSGRVQQPQDQLNAAMVLHHSGEAGLYKKAYELSLAAFEGGLEDAEWLSQASYDRWQMAIGNEQKYGTQQTISFSSK